MKIQVIAAFHDLEEGILRQPGEVITVKEERGRVLVDRGLAAPLTEAKAVHGPPEDKAVGPAEDKAAEKPRKPKRKSFRLSEDPEAVRARLK